VIQATQIRKGMLVKLNEVPHVVLTVTHITPGNKRGIVQCTMRNLQTGLSTELRFRSNDKVEEAEIEPLEMEYLYTADNLYYFMNIETYEQIAIPAELIADKAKFLQPNIGVKVEFYEGKPFGILLPKFVNLKVVETPPYLKDATAQAQTKTATLEGGHTCQVPPFVEAGNTVKVNTETGEYVERT
jgi:elongation factor P